MSHKLTPEEWKAARSLKEIGKTDREISGVLGCSRSQISQGLNQNRDQVRRNLAPQTPKSDLMKEGCSWTREEKDHTTRDRIVEALKIMKENDKRSFTTQDLKKIMPDVSLTDFSNYLAGRRGNPPLDKVVPYIRVGKMNGGRYVTYRFSEGQTVLPKGPSGLISDHDLLMSISQQVKEIKEKLGMSS